MSMIRKQYNIKPEELIVTPTVYVLLVVWVVVDMGDTLLSQSQN